MCSAYDNGDVKMFDLREMKLLWEKNVKNGVCSLEFDRKDIPMNKLLVTTLESSFHVFDCRTSHKTKGFACLTEKVRPGLYRHQALEFVQVNQLVKRIYFILGPQVHSMDGKARTPKSGLVYDNGWFRITVSLEVVSLHKF